MASTRLKVIEGNRNEMGQKALSAILRRDTTTFDDLMSKMQPRPPVVSVIPGGLEQVSNQLLIKRDANKT